MLIIYRYAISQFTYHNKGYSDCNQFHISTSGYQSMSQHRIYSTMYKNTNRKRIHHSDTCLPSSDQPVESHALRSVSGTALLSCPGRRTRVQNHTLHRSTQCNDAGNPLSNTMSSLLLHIHKYILFLVEV